MIAYLHKSVSGIERLEQVFNSDNPSRDKNAWINYPRKRGKQNYG